MDFISPELISYTALHTTPESELLKEIDRITNQKVLMPRMLSGHLQGRVLSMISKMIQPTCILEIGTYTGYSALCLAEGLAKNGKLITFDINEELEDMVRGFISKSSFESQIDFRVNDAMEIIPELSETFDLVFIDADKENYLNYYEMVLPKLRAGGIVIADNVLWSGKVISKVKNNDKETIALIEFNKFVQFDNRVENVLLPIRDGLMVIRKQG